jgi:hypothetical protein
MKFLNVGGNSKSIAVPLEFTGWEHHLLDIDPRTNPDICCDARSLKDRTEMAGRYDAVYCSHNLEHYYLHEVPLVLAGFKLVLKEDGFVLIAVPHMMNVLRRVVAYNMELTDVLYQSPSGPIIVHDVIYGWGKQIEKSGQSFFAHKCAFTPKSLRDSLVLAGFSEVKIQENDLNLQAVAIRRVD